MTTLVTHGLTLELSEPSLILFPLVLFLHSYPVAKFSKRHILYTTLVCRLLKVYYSCLGS